MILNIILFSLGVIVGGVLASFPIEEEDNSILGREWTKKEK